MKNSRMIQARSAGFAALLGLAAQTQAQYGPPTINFCPTTANYNLNQGGATYNLTCELSGVGLTITANGVKLNGNGHTLNRSPGDGIKVLGVAATISNLHIIRPLGNGIHFARTGSPQDVGIVNNVVVDIIGKDGITSSGSNTSLQVKGSQIDQARYGIDNTNSNTSPHYVDVFDSWIGDTSDNGFMAWGASTQHHARNHYEGNYNNGVMDFGNNAGYYSDSYFYYNWVGLILQNNGQYNLTLSGNTGAQNQMDCDGTRTFSLTVSNNSWNGRTEGCVTKHL